MTVRVQTLTPAHDRASFSSGSASLDRYFHELVSQDTRRRVSNCFVALDEDGSIIGFYTLAATSLPIAVLSPEEAVRLPRYPSLPAALIGRLAIDQRHQRRGLGSGLVFDAALRAAKSDAAIFALIVDAKDERAIAFYERLRFRQFPTRRNTLYLPTSVALKARAT